MSEPRVLINALTVIDGGGRSYILNLLRELGADSRGFHFTVLMVVEQLSEQELAGLEHKAVRLTGGSSLARLAQRLLYEQAVLPLVSSRFDLLYCLADMVPVAVRVPTVVALRNLNVYDRRFYNTARLRILRVVIPVGLRRARRIVFPTRASADLICPRLGIREQRVAVVHHGISGEAFEGGARAPAGVPYLFLPAALERHKNIGLLIESMRHVSDPDLELWIAGQSITDPQCAAELRALVDRLGLAAKVRFLGSVPYREIMGYYRGARALVFPSVIETFGHPLLEAMLAGTPILASDIPAFREIGGEAAVYFPLGDPRALARCIDSALSDEQGSRRRVALGRERAARFSWKSSADALCRVFAEVLSTPPAG